MAEPLAVRIRHRLRWVESIHDRKLFVECLEVMEGPDFVPKVQHPDGSGDPALTTGSFSLTADAVIDWMDEHGIRLVPWQIAKLNRL